MTPSTSQDPEEERARLRSVVRRTEQQLLDAVGIDLGLAETFLRRAAITRRDENRRQSIRDARTAYDTLAPLLPSLVCAPEERSSLTQRLAALKTRLIEWGERF